MRPIVPLVLDFRTANRSTAPSTLKELLNPDPKIDRFVNDFRINRFDLAWLPESTVEKFKSDFRAVVQALIQQQSMKSSNLVGEISTTRRTPCKCWRSSLMKTETWRMKQPRNKKSRNKEYECISLPCKSQEINLVSVQVHLKVLTSGSFNFPQKFLRKKTAMEFEGSMAVLMLKILVEDQKKSVSFLY